MFVHTKFTELVGIEHPIVQEGMGPLGTAKLAAAVSNAGGLGTVSIPGMTKDPAEGGRIIASHVEMAASLTDRPFAVNIPVGSNDRGEILPISDAYIRAIIDVRQREPEVEKRLRVVTTSAGNPAPFRGMIADTSLIHMHKVASTRQAVKAQELGVDVVIASGYEMGGHTHATPVHTFVLVPNVTAEVDVPVLLSGGARDGRTLAAALSLGAAGVAMGTRFIATEDDFDWHPAYGDRIIAAEEGDDILFPGVYGPARGLHTGGVTELEAMIADQRDPEEVTRWKDEALIRAQQEGDLEHGLIAAGQVSSGIHSRVRIAEFVPEMAAEAGRILSQLGSAVTSEPATAADERSPA